MACLQIAMTSVAIMNLVFSQFCEIFRILACQKDAAGKLMAILNLPYFASPSVLASSVRPVRDVDFITFMMSARSTFKTHNSTGASHRIGGTFGGLKIPGQLLS